MEPRSEEEIKDADVNLEDAFQGLFKTSASGSGEEELLRTAAGFAMQLTARQMKALMYLDFMASQYEEPIRSKVLNFVDMYIRLKSNNNSDVYVMRALDSISLRKFINENSMKVNIEK